MLRKALRALATCTVMILAPATHAVEIIAHRGASADAPENTLSAMKLAWEQGADAIELDLWLSKDGKILVFHDGDTKRMAKVDRKITDYTAEEAAKLDVGAWKGAQFTGERIPSLESILETIPAGKRALIELKSGAEIVPELARVLKASGKAPGQLVIISFKESALVASKKLLPELEHYPIYGYKKDDKGNFPELAPLIARAKAEGFAGLDLHYGWPIDAEMVRKVKAEGLKVLVWTVNDAEVAKKMVAAGVEGITTDKPGWLREELKKGK